MNHLLLEIERSRLFSVVKGRVCCVVGAGFQLQDVIHPLSSASQQPGLKVQSAGPHLHICQCLECNVSYKYTLSALVRYSQCGCIEASQFSSPLILSLYLVLMRVVASGTSNIMLMDTGFSLYFCVG